VGSNSNRIMNICPRLTMLRCPVYLEALRRGDHSSTESYHMSKQIHNYIIDSDLQQVKSLIRKS
jgi:hypothetical protein